MDFSSEVTQAITGWLHTLSTSLLQPALDAARPLLFSTPAFDGMPEIQQAWSEVRDLADATFVLAVLAGGILIMSSGAFETHYTVKLLLPRLVLAGLLSNASLQVCGALIRFDNGVIAGLVGSDGGAAIWSQITAGIGGTITDQVLASVAGLAAAVIAILLVAVFLVRDVVLLLAIVLSPLALATYGVPPASWVARLWWRILAASLLVQPLEALLVSLGLTLTQHTQWLGAPGSALVTSLVLLTLLYLLVKLPLLGYRWAFGHSASNSSVVRTVVLAAKAAGIGA